MRPLFPSPPPPPPMPRDPDRAVLVRRALQDRLLETLRYLAEEIEVRRVGGLGEAQAAGYVAGRLQRAEQQTTVISFRTGIGQTIAIGLVTMLAVVGSGISVALPDRGIAAAALLLIFGVVGLLWAEIEGVAPIGHVLGRRSSQSVIGVRAAVGSNEQPRLRAVLVAPLDSVPQVPPRRLLLLLFQVCGFQALLLTWLLFTQRPALRSAVAAGTLILAILVASILIGHVRYRPQPAVMGAGELAVLVAVAEELGELQHVELWTIAVGAASVGDLGMQRLLERYPFGSDTCFINLHHMTGGQPVFVTREGLLREWRSDRRLLALASGADAVDVTINAEPRQLRQRTLAALLLRRGYRAITITSHPETRGFASLDPATLERCVSLIVGMIRELDQEEARVQHV